MLIAISVISIIGFILTDIMSQVFRGQNKINTVSLVKQNGQVVLDKLSNEIRSAEKVICNGSAVGGPKDTVVLFRNGNYTRFRFVLPTALASGYFSREDFNLANLVLRFFLNISAPLWEGALLIIFCKAFIFSSVVEASLYSSSAF